MNNLTEANKGNEGEYRGIHIQISWIPGKSCHFSTENIFVMHPSIGASPLPCPRADAALAIPEPACIVSTDLISACLTARRSRNGRQGWESNPHWDGDEPVGRKLILPSNQKDLPRQNALNYRHHNPSPVTPNERSIDTGIESDFR